MSSYTIHSRTDSSSLNTVLPRRLRQGRLSYFTTLGPLPLQCTTSTAVHHFRCSAPLPLQCTTSAAVHHFRKTWHFRAEPQCSLLTEASGCKHNQSVSPIIIEFVACCKKANVFASLNPLSGVFRTCGVLDGSASDNFRDLVLTQYQHV